MSSKIVINLTDRGDRLFRSLIALSIIVVGLFIFGLIASLCSLNEVEIVKPLDKMQYISKVQDSGESYCIFKGDKGHDRWYRVIVIDDSTNFVSEYPAIIDCGDDLLIRVKWDPNKHVDCKTFLRIVGKNKVEFCQRYHLPVDKIRAVCGGF